MLEVASQFRGAATIVVVFGLLALVVVVGALWLKGVYNLNARGTFQAALMIVGALIVAVVFIVGVVLFSYLSIPAMIIIGLLCSSYANKGRN